MSYRQVLADVSSTLGTSVSSVNVVPANWQGSTGTEEFLRVNVFPANSLLDTFDATRIQGFIAINIFVAAGDGAYRGFEVADALDVLLNKRLINRTQFEQSRLNVIGLDSANSNLWRVDYVIDFTSTSA